MQGQDSGEVAQTIVSEQTVEEGYLPLSLALFHPSSSIFFSKFSSRHLKINPQFSVLSYRNMLFSGENRNYNDFLLSLFLYIFMCIIFLNLYVVNVN